MNAEKSYRIAVGGTDLGEVPLTGVLQRWRAGELDESAYYFDESRDEWVPLAGLVKMRTSGKSAVPVPPEPTPAPAPETASGPLKLRKYSTPILALIFNILGTLVIVCGAAAAVIAFAVGFRGPGLGGGLFTSIGIFLISFLQGIFLLGIGQVINYVGRIAYETERTADLLEAKAA